jgi:hypothetical protein
MATPDLHQGPSANRAPVMCRALAIGLIAGSVVGGTVGTVIVPIAGTIIGAIVGGGVGLVAGLINGIVLAIVVALTESVWAAAAAGGLTTLGCAAGFGWGGQGPIWAVRDPVSWIVIAVCGLLGAALSPIATRGPKPLSFGSRCPRSPGGFIGRFVTLGACGGVVLVQVWILAFDLPRAPRDSLGGEVFGAVAGAVIGLFLSTAIVAPWLRPR